MHQLGITVTILMVLLSVAKSEGAATSHCVYTIYGWAQRAAGQQMPTDTLCRDAWTLLLRKDAAQLIVTDNQLWLLTAQQYIMAQLNQRIALANGANATRIEPIQRATMLLGDSLERGCGNVSQWSIRDPQRQQLMTLLTNFNHGQMPDIAPACSDEFLSVGDDGSGLETYQYLHGDDIIVLRDANTNQTLITSLVAGLYAALYGLYAINALPLLLAFALGVKLAMHMDWKHKYTLNRRLSTLDDARDYELHVRTDSGTVSEVSLSQREETFDVVDI